MKSKTVWLSALLCVVFCLLPVLALGESDDSEFVSPTRPPNAPEYSTSEPEALKDSQIVASSYLLMERETGEILMSRDEEVVRFPASTTKIMTALVALQFCDDLDAVLTVSESAVAFDDEKAERVPFKAGEQITLRTALYGLLVKSGNDAANVIAEYVAGDVPSFVNLMNQTAAAIGCTSTNFVNPHGLHDASHVTTARDLYKIIKHAMTLPHFTEITSQTRYTIPPTNKSENARTLVTTNYMINKNSPRPEYYYQYAKGIKTGSHDEAGHCLASTAIKGGYTYLCIALGSPSVDAEGNYIAENGAMIDSKALYEWAFDNLELKTIVSREQVMKEIKLELAWNKDTILLTPGQEFSTIMPENVEASSVTITVDVPESITAPVQAGLEERVSFSSMRWPA